MNQIETCMGAGESYLREKVKGRLTRGGINEMMEKKFRLNYSIVLLARPSSPH